MLLQVRPPRIDERGGLHRRAQARQPLAQQEADSVGGERLVAALDAGVALDPAGVVEQRFEIGRNAGHSLAAEGLDARLLHGVENGAARLRRRRPSAVQGAS